MVRKKKIIIPLLIIAGLFFILPGIGFLILKWGILPPHKLTPLVLNETNKLINGKLECDKIELTFLETYPHLGIRLSNGRITSHVLQDSTGLSLPDSLLSFNTIVLSLKPIDYLLNKQITIGKAEIDDIDFYGYVSPEGISNWNIYQPQSDTIPAETQNDTLPIIDLQQLVIRNAHFIYDDRLADLYAEIDGFFLNISGSLVKGGNNFILEMRSSSILFESPDYTLENRLALELKSKIRLTDNYRTITLDNATLRINDLPFTASGTLSYPADSERIRIDAEMGMNVSDMNDLLGFVPDSYFKDRNKIKATGSVTVDGSIHGMAGDSILPVISMCCKIDKGSLYMKGIDQGIESLETDFDLYFNGEYPDSSFISLKKLMLKGLNSSFHIRGEVSDLSSSPSIDTYMKGSIDFTRLGEEFLNLDSLYLEGNVDADLTASFKIDDLITGKYNNVNLLGKLDIETLKARSIPLDMDVYFKGIRLLVDSTKSESSYLPDSDLLTMSLTADSVSIKYKDEINSDISKLEIRAKTSVEPDTSAVIPLTTHIKMEHLKTRLPDSVMLSCKGVYLKGGVKPSASNKQLPVIGASITVDTLNYLMLSLRTGAILAKNTFNVEALPFRDAMRQQRQDRKNPERNRPAHLAERSRMRRIADTTGVDDPSRQLLRRWEVRGSVLFEKMRIFSRLFPLRMYMDKTNVKFNTNTITLTNARLKAGKSDFTLTGEASGMRSALLRGGKLKGNFNLTSDYIDCNQLIGALNRGLLYAEQHFSEERFDTEHIDELTMENTDEFSDSTNTVFVVPEYLDLTLNTHIKQMDFKDLTLENVTGEAVMRNQSINLRKLDMESNIGLANLTMVYTSKDRSGAFSGVELDMKNILIGRLIDLYPEIDTLLPMLRSFEGVVDCRMTAVCDIDSAASVVLPSLRSACFLHGENMVLLDGETFAEISKTLMFKNKKRNLIDSISVDLVIADGKIEIFPFLLEMDRYRAAVGGTHNLDMTFNYHISVLKSPVPFKLGIDVSGNLDKFKYKITKCKYKDILKPVKVKELDDIRINLRKEIRESIRKRLLENAPELANRSSEESSGDSLVTIQAVEAVE